MYHAVPGEKPPVLPNQRGEDPSTVVTSETCPIEEYAVKVYRTSVLTFKDRDRYVTGEFRFRRGYSRNNPRKMVFCSHLILRVFGYVIDSLCSKAFSRTWNTIGPNVG